MVKRGVSPLIATVLIISFTIALGVLVYLWGGDFVRGMTDKASEKDAEASTCAAASMKLTRIDQAAPNKINFVLENTGSPDIETVIVRVTGNNGLVSVSKPGVKSSSKKLFVADFDPVKVGVVKSVEVVPTVNVNNKILPCTPGLLKSAVLPAGTAQMWAQACGNGQVEEWEECDGSNLNGISDCAGIGYESGILSCNSMCTYEISGCSKLLSCGNYQLDSGEECDLASDYSSIIDGSITCGDVGYDLGDLGCTDYCSIDTASCGLASWVCGNNIKEWDEECDGTDLGGLVCIDYGFSSGSLFCDECSIDTSSCESAGQVCGNNIKEGSEECDGTDLAGVDCSTVSDPLSRPPGEQPAGDGGLGRVPGSQPAPTEDPDPLTGLPGSQPGSTLVCSADCTFDTSGC